MKAHPANEVRSLTGLRGIACIYVMLFHFGSLLLNFDRSDKPAIVFLSHGYLAVDLFFALSGFVMAFNYGHTFENGFSWRAYRAFLAKRIARIYPLYVICTAIGFGLYLVGSMRVNLNENYSAVVLVYNIAMVQVWGFAESFNGPEWSISAEWAAYLCFPALLPPLLFKDRAIVATCIGGCVAVLFAICYIPNTIVQGRVNGSLDLFEPWYGISLLRCLTEFSFGIVIYRISMSGSEIYFPKYIDTVIAILCVFLLSIKDTDFLVAIIYPVLIYSLVASSGLVVRILASTPLEFLGRLSYSIYLIHELVLAGVFFLRPEIRSYGVTHWLRAAVGLAVIIVPVVAYLSYRFVELPARRWLQRKLLRQH